MPSSDLAEYFRHQASWRELKAEEYPHDARNTMSAKALRSLAGYVEEGGGNAQTVELLDAHLVEGFSLGGERAQRAVVRYGYGHLANTFTHDEFLEELLVDCMEDAYDFAGEHGDDATDALLPFEIDAATDGVYLPRRYWERRSDQVEHELEQAVASYREPIDADEKGGE